MTESRIIPWKRIGVEAVAIVVSILLAFAIDAWWDERQERQDEIEILERLLLELSVNIERIENFIVRGNRKIEYASELFDQIEKAQAQGDETIDVPTMMLMHLADAETYEADIPVLQGIIRSARLEVIENESILAAIAQWESRLRGYTEVAHRARQNTDNRFIPSLHERGDTGHVFMRIDGPDSLKPDSDPNDVTAIRIDDQFKALVAERVENTLRATGVLETAHLAAINAREVIETAK